MFENTYGITIDDLIKLSRDRFVLPVITDHFSYYPKYYDKLFELYDEGKIARWGRLVKALDFIKKEETGISIREETKKDISKRFGGGLNFEELIEEHEKGGFSTEVETNELLSTTFYSYLSGFRLLEHEEIYKNESLEPPTKSF